MMDPKKIVQRYAARLPIFDKVLPPSVLNFFDSDTPPSPSLVSGPNRSVVDKLLGESPSMEDASSVLKSSLVRAYYYYRRNSAWAVEVADISSKAEAERFGKKLQKNLAGKRSVKSSDPMLHHKDLYVVYDGGFVKVNALPEVKDTSKSDLKYSILFRAKNFFGAKGATLSGREGAYSLTVYPYLLKLKGKFRTTTFKGTLEDISKQLDNFIQTLERI